MISTIITYLRKQFNQDLQQSNSYGADLEAYIISKNPTSVAEIEYLTKQYDRNQTTSSWLT